MLVNFLTALPTNEIGKSGQTSMGRMKMEGMREFLESTTIHGLVYISTSKSKLQKIFWVSVVLREGLKKWKFP